MAIDSSVKVVRRESVDGAWIDKFILEDDRFNMLEFVISLSGPCIEDGEGETTGLPAPSAS
jgi:hypothetical protein